MYFWVTPNKCKQAFTSNWEFVKLKNKVIFIVSKKLYNVEEICHWSKTSYGYDYTQLGNDLNHYIRWATI